MTRGKVVGVVLVVLALVAAAAAAAVWARGPAPRTEADTAALFPVTVRRTGGIAGVDDRAVVTSTGDVTLTRRKGPVGSCKLGSADVEELADLAAQTRPGRTPVADADVADAFHYELESRGGTTSFGSGDNPEVVTDLISAVEGNPSRCR
jgi:hypothetical protein